MVNFKSKVYSPAIKVILGSFLISSFIAFYILVIFWPQGNPYEEIKVEIPKGSNLTQITESLARKQIIANQKSFRLAVKILGYELSIPAGVFSIKNAHNNYQIIQQLVFGKPELIKVRLLEGWTLRKSIQVLRDKLNLNEDKLLQLCFDPQFAMKHGIPAPNLEGFLYPDTYRFPEGITVEEVLIKLLSEYRSNVDKDVIAKANNIGFSELELITMASIIEGEAIYNSERQIISAVYHNRLKQSMRLQADPTIQYIIDDGPRRLLNRDLKIKSPYNTYLNYGLPPGPINNPGRQSILAAVNPDENDYLYFVAKGDGYHTFSRNEKEHNRAKREFQKVRRKVRSKIKKN